MKAAGISLGAVAIAAAASSANVTAQRDAGRVRPPEAVTCPRDQLTAYTGRVMAFDRRQDRTTVVIRTDWDTTERAVIAHPDTYDPTRWFLRNGKPFAAADWAALESAPGHLRPDIRATAWVCANGTNPIVDWSPVTEPQPPPAF